MIANVLGIIYIVVVIGIAAFGSLGIATFWYYWKHRHDRHDSTNVDGEDLPKVTVQLPLYNERLVVRRLIESAAALEYPKEKLQIQVLDDSVDETTALAEDLVLKYRAAGYDIELIHRAQRDGFKAGALEVGLLRATGEFIAVFDADFAPLTDFLLQTIPHFIGDPGLGMIQTRWGHLNPGESALTAAQSIALDKHFVMEQGSS